MVFLYLTSVTNTHEWQDFLFNVEWWTVCPLLYLYMYYYMIYTILYIYIFHMNALCLFTHHSLTTLSLVPLSFWGEQWCSAHEALSHFMMITSQETCTTCWRAWKKNQVIEEGVYFGSQLESVVYHENEVPAEKLETTSQITSLVMKHREMKASSLLAFFLSPTLCPRYMKRCSFQLNCVVLPQFRSRKSLIGIQMIVSRSCRAEN